MRTGEFRLASLPLCSCGAPATSGSSRDECGRCFRRRLASFTLGAGVTETRTRRSYYDSDVLADVVPLDAKERMLDATDGLGYAKLDREGRPWHRDRNTGEIQPVSDRDIDRVYLAGDTEA